MTRDDIDETWHECPCGRGQVYTYLSTPNHSFGKGHSSWEIRCDECRKRYTIRDLLMFKTEETVLSAVGGGEDVQLGSLKTIRRRSNY